MNKKMLRLTPALREWIILGCFILLTLIMLYPLSIYLNSMVPEPTDPLLNVWRMQWNAHAALSGPEGITNLFNTNIFYPFPLTLAYSEHFLMIAAQALPFLLVADGHLIGMNLSVLLTFVLSGYAMYLLMADWTGQRWAGLIAGLLFAFSPHRFGQLNHLELLITQWMPLTLLALHWTLTRPGFRYSALFIIFFNLQVLSGFHYGFNLAIACGLLTLVYLITKRIHWRRGLWVAAALAFIITMIFNWPIARIYFHFSNIMGAVRTPGEVRIYSAAFTDYLTTIPHNWLYGWTFGHWQSAGHQFQPLMPFGVVGFLLAVIGIIFAFIPKKQRQQETQPVRARYVVPGTIFLILLTLTGFLLSFGLNEEALGPTMSTWLAYSPYPWLYENIAAFQGIRVPGRYGILVVLGLTGLAGWGVAHLAQLKLWQKHQWEQRILPASIIILITLITLEYWSVPLEPAFAVEPDPKPVYHWLQQKTPPDTVVLELPFQGVSEFIYEYNSSYHWRRLANGGTGFTPPIYEDMRQWFNAFPDARSIDVIQQMGIDLVILHPESYHENDWPRIHADLPHYLPNIQQITQVGDALVLNIAPPACRPDPAQVQVSTGPSTLDGMDNVLQVNYHNTGLAAFVADVQKTSWLKLADGTVKDFTEPLVTPANETQTVVIPFAHEPAGITDIRLASLGVISNTESPPALREGAWQPLGLQFENGPQLIAYQLTSQTPTPCSTLTVSLKWKNGQPEEKAVVQLLDPFGRVVIENTARPWQNSGNIDDTRTLSLVGPLSPGSYGLRVYVRTAEDSERLPITEEGVTIPTIQIPPLPVTIHPTPLVSTDQSISPITTFGDSINLIGVELNQQQVAPGDWLQFSLIWQTTVPLDTDLTVFTQLIGPDGQVWGQQDTQPGGGWYNTSLWLPNYPFADHYAFQIQPDAPSGEYRLIAGLYTNTLERLTTPSDADFVNLGTVTVE